MAKNIPYTFCGWVFFSGGGKIISAEKIRQSIAKIFYFSQSKCSGMKWNEIELINNGCITKHIFWNFISNIFMRTYIVILENCPRFNRRLNNVKATEHHAATCSPKHDSNGTQNWMRKKTAPWNLIKDFPPNKLERWFVGNIFNLITCIFFRSIHGANQV